MSDRLRAALAQIDNENQHDPNLINGEPLALTQGRKGSKWLTEIAPDASEELQLAARAHHLKRWELKRSGFPAGRSGYLNWRRKNKEHQAQQATQIMKAVGYNDDALARVHELLLRRKLGSDPETQALEDVACLTFIETEFDQVAERLTEDKMVSVLAKTLKKMSPEAIKTSATIPMSDRCRHLMGLAQKQA